MQVYVLTLEGVGGCGKTTLADRIYKTMSAYSEIQKARREKHNIVIRASFPSEHIRAFMNDEARKPSEILKKAANVQDQAERFDDMFAHIAAIAAQDEAVSDKAFIICDRGAPSTFVYHEIKRPGATADGMGLLPRELSEAFNDAAISHMRDTRHMFDELALKHGVSVHLGYLLMSIDLEELADIKGERISPNYPLLNEVQRKELVESLKRANSLIEKYKYLFNIGSRMPEEYFSYSSLKHMPLTCYRGTLRMETIAYKNIKAGTMLSIKDLVKKIQTTGLVTADDLKFEHYTGEKEWNEYVYHALVNLLPTNNHLDDILKWVLTLNKKP